MYEGGSWVAPPPRTCWETRQRPGGVAVLAVPDEEISHRLVAEIVPQTDPELTVRQLKDFVGTHLPKYMIPDTFYFVEQLPQTSTGKVDRRKLLALVGHHA